MTFNWEVSVGNLISIVTMLVIVGGFLLRLAGYLQRTEGRLMAIETKVTALWEWFTQGRGRRDLPPRP